MKYYPEKVNYIYGEGYFTNSRHYDKFAHCESQDIFRRQAEMIQDVIGSFNGKTILDVGGALGWFAKRCEDKGATAFCQEISEWACENSPITNRMRCGDAGKNLLFDNNSFDIVISIEALEHIDDIKHCFEEIARVLKPNGLLYCSVGLNIGSSHVWIGTIEEWEEVINKTPNLSVVAELTQKMRQHPYAILQNWSTIIAKKVIG